MIRIINLIIITLLASLSTYAQDKPEHELQLGLAVASSQSIYLGGENRVQAFPAINYKYKKFYFQGGDLGFHLIDNDQVEINLDIGADFIGDIDRGDSPLLADMPSLSIPINAAIEFTYKTSIGYFSAEYGHEITNKHSGNSVKLTYSALIPVGSWKLYPSLSWQQHSQEIVNYFYGVNLESVSENRPFYQADKGQSQTLGVLMTKPINDKWSFLGNIGITYYSSEITNSPIVDDDQSFGVFAGMMYRFF